jgi:WD40 repeat protein
LWNATTGQQLRTFDQGSYWGAWSPDGARLVFADGIGAHSISVWDVETGERLATLSVPDDEYGAPQLLTMNWSPDSAFIAAADFRPGFPQPIYVWDAETAELILTFQTDDLCHLGWPRWSPDGSRIATGCIFVESGINTPIRIWDAASAEELMVLESEYGWTYRAVWSPDGKRLLATYEDGAAQIWDAATGKPILTFTGHQGVVDGEWSPDGTLIASTDFAEQVVKIWDSETGEELFNFSVAGAPLTIGWSPDGTRVIVTGDGLNEPVIKRVWRSTEELVEYAYDCCVSRELTPEEREQFGLPLR